MSEKPTIEKLPKWAQEHIKNLQRERDVAVRELNEWVDSQTISPIFIEEHTCIGEQCGPSLKRRYIQGYKVEFEWSGIHLTTLLADPSDGQRNGGICLSWREAGRSVTTRIALIPTGFQQVELVTKEKMR